MQPRHSDTTSFERGVQRPRSKSNGPSREDKPAEKKSADRKKSVDLRLNLPHANRVCIAGSFNDWDPKKTPMRKDGVNWTLTLSLPPGRYEYKFVADGQWMSDPEAKESVRNDFGGNNSILVV